MPEAAADLWDSSTKEGGVSPPHQGFEDLDGTTVNHLVHVAYRHSDLKSAHSRQQHQHQHQAPLTAKVMNVGEGDTLYKDSVVSWPQRTEQQENGENIEKTEPQLNSKREQYHLAGQEYPRRSLSESKTSHMPFVVEHGASGPKARDTDPLGQYQACPSSPRVLQVGIAMDTGYFKVSRPVYSRSMLETYVH